LRRSWPLKRVELKACAATQQWFIEAMGEESHSRVPDRLDDSGLPGAADAQQRIGTQVRIETARETNIALKSRLTKPGTSLWYRGNSWSPTISFPKCRRTGLRSILISTLEGPVKAEVLANAPLHLCRAWWDSPALFAGTRDGVRSASCCSLLTL